MKKTLALMALYLLALLGWIAPSKAQDPGIIVSDVPTWGDVSGILSGQVWNTTPTDYRVLVYLYFEGHWYVKPYDSAPLTPIQNNLTWTCDVTTGGSDQYATRFLAFLVPDTISPPVGQQPEYLPAWLYAYPYDQRCRLPGTRRIFFSGYNWVVKQCETPIGPGPNFFTDQPSDVWVDSLGSLHLQIAYRNGYWYSAEVIADTVLGYGKYVFQVQTRMDNINAWAVAGFYTWDEYAPPAPPYAHREIDVEGSRWGDPQAIYNAQYVVQPWDVSGNRLQWTLGPDSSTTHWFDWRSDSIRFQSSRGYSLNPPPQSILQTWLYTGSFIPSEGQENPRINWWLFQAHPPAGGQPVELIIKAFEFLSDSVNGIKDKSGCCLPSDFRLESNPNPFNATTTIQFTLPHSAQVELKVYDLSGSELATLTQGWRSAGVHKQAFNGAALASGVYLCCLESDGLIITQKLLLVK